MDVPDELDLSELRARGMQPNEDELLDDEKVDASGGCGVHQALFAVVAVDQAIAPTVQVSCLL